MLKKAIATTALVASLSAPAFAGDWIITEPHTGDRSMLLELHAGFAYGLGGPAVGARLGIPLIKNGFIGSLNNAFYINFGADVYTTFYGARFGGAGLGIGIGIPVTGQWNFYFSEKLSAFGEVGLNIYFNTRYFGSGARFFYPGDWITASVGGRYHLSEKFALMARLGTPYLAVGIELAL